MKSFILLALSAIAIAGLDQHSAPDTIVDRSLTIEKLREGYDRDTAGAIKQGKDDDITQAVARLTVPRVFAKRRLHSDEWDVDVSAGEAFVAIEGFGAKGKDRSSLRAGITWVHSAEANDAKYMVWCEWFPFPRKEFFLDVQPLDHLDIGIFAPNDFQGLVNITHVETGQERLYAFQEPEFPLRRSHAEWLVSRVMKMAPGYPPRPEVGEDGQFLRYRYAKHDRVKFANAQYANGKDAMLRKPIGSRIKRMVTVAWGIVNSKEPAWCMLSLSSKDVVCLYGDRPNRSLDESLDG